MALLAFLLSIGVFAFWAALGYAAVSWVGTHLSPLRNQLVAPAVGMVLHAIPLILLSMAGFPIARVALPVAGCLALFAILLLWRGRGGKLPPWREYLPFAGILLGAMVLTGRPFFQFGFDWISFCNDDMANYVMGAQRLLDHGYFDVPTAQRLLGGYDYSEYLYFLHVPGMHRPGSELLLGFVSRLTGIPTSQVFMPVILAVHLVLISGTAAMACSDSESRNGPALAAAGLLACSALASLGTLYQLIAQVAGLGVLTACATLLMRPFDRQWTRGEVTRYGLLLGVLLAGLAVMYAEIAPFLAIGYSIYAVVGILRGRLPVRPLLAVGIVASLTALLVLNRAVPTILAYILRQSGTGIVPEDPRLTLFPYYLMPTGLANLWGFQRVATAMIEPFQSAAIGVGGFLLIGVVVAAVRRTWQGFPAATLTLVMLVIGVVLFRAKSGFGLFKLAMFLQPFMLATLAAAWFEFVRKREGWRRRGTTAAMQVVPLASLAALGMYAQTGYVNSSCGVGRTFVEVPDASASRVLAKMRQVVRDHPSDRYLIDSYNVVLAKLQTTVTRGHQALFPSNRLFHVGGYVDYPGFDSERILTATRSLIDAHGHGYDIHRFDLHDGKGGSNPFSVSASAVRLLTGAGTAAGNVVVIGTTPKQNIFNRRHNTFGDEANFYGTDAAATRNHLVFIASELGQPYFAGGGRAKYALFQLENEPQFFKGRTMAGVGHHLLFQVLGPSPNGVRVVLEFTSSYRADGENVLPPASVVGTTREPLGMIGRGSSRIVSPPVKPQMIDGLAYVAIDFGEDGKQFPTPRTGLMNLYGIDVSTDRRKLVGFIRDVSVIGADEYTTLAPPSRIGSFGRRWYEGHDLINPNLEYSGLYEDGWVGGEAFFHLSEPADAGWLVMRGQVPLVGDANVEIEGELLLDGHVVARQALHAGDFEMRGRPDAPQRLSPVGCPGRRVEVRFSRLQRLRAPDNRPVAARIFSIGFES